MTRIAGCCRRPSCTPRREVIDRVLASRVCARGRAAATAGASSRASRSGRSIGRRASRAISGAVMAIRASAFDAAGGFDERFPLYFEENDFLRRVRGDVVYVPSARCRHLYNQSAAGSPRSGVAVRAIGAALPAKVGRRIREAIRERHAANPRRPTAATSDNVVLEASPLANFETAAGNFDGVADISDDIWSTYRGDVLYLRAVDRRTRPRTPIVDES